MNKISFFFSVFIVLFFCGSVNTLAAYEGNTENQMVVIDRIISNHIDPETGKTFLKLSDSSYPVLQNIKVYNADKKRCGLMNLQLPFTARIVMIKDELGLWSVTEIRPHEE